MVPTQAEVYLLFFFSSFFFPSCFMLVTNAESMLKVVTYILQDVITFSFNQCQAPDRGAGADGEKSGNRLTGITNGCEESEISRSFKCMGEQ